MGTVFIDALYDLLELNRVNGKGKDVFAERKGFEPSIRCRIHAFQACALSHSATSLKDTFRSNLRLKTDGKEQKKRSDIQVFK